MTAPAFTPEQQAIIDAGRAAAAALADLAAVDGELLHQAFLLAAMSSRPAHGMDEDEAERLLIWLERWLGAAALTQLVLDGHVGVSCASAEPKFWALPPSPPPPTT